ncbi:MAG: cell wall-active antibiotics response protein [Bacillota bacterium]
MGRWILGIAVTLTGVSLLMNNLGFTDFEVGRLVWTYWPLLLVYWGLAAIVRAFRSSALPYGEALLGGVILVAGVLILGRNLGWFDASLAFLWRVFWPLVIVLLGLSLLKGSSRGSATQWAFMSGIQLGKQPWEPKNGSYVAVMGGVDLDLTRATIPDGDLYLDFTAFMGGADIKVPRDLSLTCEGWVFLGGLGFLGEESGGILASKRVEQRPETPSRSHVHIQGRAIMGGIDVKRVG